MKNLILSIAASLLLSVSHGNYPDADRDFKIGFTGDIIMHNNIKKCADVLSLGETNNYGYDYLFDKIRDETSSADIMCGNMEFPVCPPFKSDGFIFNAPPHITDALKSSGFDILSIANNHITDQKTSGVLYTVSLLESKKLDYIGAGLDEKQVREGIIREKNGIRAGFLSYTGLINYTDRRQSGKYYINWIYDREKVAADIALMRTKCDFLTVQIHDGIEYTTVPAEWKVKLYREIADLGADLIIGHHPHVIQSSESYTAADGRMTTIFYSLGNFISDQRRDLPIGETDETVSIKSSFIVYLHLYKRWFKLKHHIEVLPVFTVNSADSKNGVYFRNIQVVPMRTEIKSLESAAAEIKTENEAGSPDKIKNEINAVKKVVFPGIISDNINYLDYYPGE